MKLPQLPTKEPIRGLLSVPWLSFFTGLLGYIKELPTQTQIATVQQISSDALRNLKEIDLINEVAAQTATISGEIHTAVDEVRTVLEDELAIARAEIEAGYTAADAVIDAEVTTLSSTVGTVQADLATELITRASADSALSASITTLNTSLGTTNANLTSEAITRAAADSALTGSFTTLSSTVGTVQSDLSTEMVTRANADSALSASITTLTSNLGTTNANLSAEAITRANDDSALSASITSLSTTVGGHTTSISSLTSTTNGLNAVYGVTINNNGHVSGFALNSTAAANGGLPTSAFVIQADKFVLIDPGTAYTSGNSPPTANIPFAVIGGVTYIKSANIQDLTIGTNHLGANAVTKLFEDTLVANATIPSSDNYIDELALTVQSSAGVLNCRVTLFVETLATNASNNNVQLYIDIYKNGTFAKTTPAAYEFLQPVPSLRTLPIASLQIEASLDVSASDAIILKIRGQCESASKLQVGAVHCQSTLYKK